MFPLRCLAAFALVAAASSLPAQEKPIPTPITTITNDEIAPAEPVAWFNFPFFGDAIISKLFAPLWKLFPSFEDLGPRILNDDGRFQVIMEVKDFKKEDLKVKVKGDFIFVQGSHEANNEDHDVFASQFFHTYSLPANSSASDVTAELTSDSFLIVNAPINGPVDRSQETDREVPILETGSPFKKEEVIKKPNFNSEHTPELTTLEPVSASEEPREPVATTPSDREEATDKDNDIPHGNEVSP